MGSTYFPLNANSEGGKKLLMAAQLIYEVCSPDLYEAILAQGEWDNCCDDGGHWALLQLARDLVLKEVRGRPAAKAQEKEGKDG